jgi:glycerophosphoryl diester phosphodiesterase
VCELKNPSHFKGKLEPKVLEMLQQRPALFSRTMVESFDFESLRQVHELHTGVPLGALFFKPWDYYRVPSFCTHVVPMADTFILNPWILWQAHRDGRKLFLWFAFLEPWILNFVIWLGVDGVIIDEPRLLPESKRH